jgi:hypothetical protein
MRIIMLGIDIAEAVLNFCLAFKLNENPATYMTEYFTLSI